MNKSPLYSMNMRSSLWLPTFSAQGFQKNFKKHVKEISQRLCIRWYLLYTLNGSNISLVHNWSEIWSVCYSGSFWGPQIKLSYGDEQG